MADQEVEQTIVEDATSAAVNAAQDAAVSTERAEDVIEAAKEAIVNKDYPAFEAIVASQKENAATLGRLVSLVESMGSLLQENLNAFSRALSNTDISAQRAAQNSADVKEAIAPPEESAPNASERPADIKELPSKEIEQTRSKTWWFGKAALRHGKGRPTRA